MNKDQQLHHMNNTRSLDHNINRTIRYNMGVNILIISSKHKDHNKGILKRKIPWKILQWIQWIQLIPQWILLWTLVLILQILFSFLLLLFLLPLLLPLPLLNCMLFFIILFKHFHTDPPALLAQAQAQDLLQEFLLLLYNISLLINQ